MSKNSLMTVMYLVAVMLLVSATPTSAQISDTEAWASHLSNTYRVVPNVTYGTANNQENKVDLYLPRGAAEPTPVLMYMHGGGWVGGTKESNVLRLLPWLERGWAVVNVQYRLGAVSLAPAAVEDCLCALRWVVRNADEYNIDPSHIVTTGNSAGGHLALATGMIPAAAGLDRQCPGNEELLVAAIINWYGITDVGDLLDGANMRNYAVQWMGSMPDRFEIAERVSPLTYVRAGLPPILSIHGDADPTVPYQHGVQLHEELSKVGVTNELHTVPGGRHGSFNRAETISIFETIDRFLTSNGLASSGSE